MAGEKILVVEDNSINLELVTDLLEFAGFVVCPARSAEDGISLAKSIAPRLILLDVGLPGMDGLAAASLLRQDPATRHIPIVVLTAHAMKGNEEKALATGCVGYITKPIDTRAFVPTIGRLMEQCRDGACSDTVKEDVGGDI